LRNVIANDNLANKFHIVQNITRRLRHSRITMYLTKNCTEFTRWLLQDYRTVHMFVDYFYLRRPILNC